MLSITAQNFSERFARLCSNLDEEQIVNLVGHFEVQEVAAGEALIAEGTDSDALYLVWDGELDVSMATPAGDGEVGHVRAGAYLGEVSLMDPGPATATVVAETGCLALRLTRTRFAGLCEHHPDIAGVLLTELSKVLADRIRMATTRLGALTHGAAAATERSETSVQDRLIAVHGTLYEASPR